MATGVEFFAFPASNRKNTSLPVLRFVKARERVVLSSGTLGTPQILERSGIGNSELLKKAGIKDIKSDLSGVGENYLDHNIVFQPYKVVLPPGNSLTALLKDPETVGAAISGKAPQIGWNSARLHLRKLY